MLETMNDCVLLPDVCIGCFIFAVQLDYGGIFLQNISSSQYIECRERKKYLVVWPSGRKVNYEFVFLVL